MKLIILSIFITTYSFAQLCTPEFKNKHLTIISNINSVMLEKRADCVESDNENAICSLEEAKQDYNKILAKLVIEKGIDALKQDLEVSYKDVQNLTSKKINEAIKSVEDFENALIKTEVLSESLKLKDGKRTIDLVNKDDIDFATTLATKCTSTPSDYCKRLEKLTLPQQEKTVEFMEAFIESFHIAYEQRDYDTKYSQLREVLSFKVDGNDIKIEDFTKSEDYKKIQKIKDSLKDLMANKNEKTAKEIVQLSSSLKDLKANFGNKVASYDEITENVKTYLENDLNNISNAYTILTKTEPIKESLNQTLKLIDAQNKMSLDSLDRDIKDKFNSDCKDKTTSQCVNYLKQVSPSKGSTVINKHKEIITSEKYGSVLVKAKECLNNKNSNIEKVQCIKQIKKQYPLMFNDKLSDLERKLEKAKLSIAKFSKQKEISDLEASKILSLISLKQNGCLENTQVSLNCNNTNSFDTATFNLGTDLQSVVAQINIDQYKRLSKLAIKKENANEKSLPNEKIESNTTTREVAASATTNTASSSSNLTLTKAQKKKFRKSNRKIKRANRIEKRELRWAKNESKRRSGTSGGSSFFNGLNSSLAMGIPQFMAQANQMQQIRYEREQRKQYYDYYIQSMRNYNSYNNGLYMNWGANAYNPYYANNFNYGNSNLYYGANYPQYTYGNDNIGNTYFNTSSSSNTNTSTTSPFSFEFSQN